MSEKGKFPKRIVSLTPSLTEILFALRLGHQVVGVTDSCDHPAEVKDIPNIGCWFDPDLEKLFALKPDLVLGLQTAHNQIKLKLESERIRVVLVNPITVNEAITDIAWVGEMLSVRELPQILVAKLRSRLSSVDNSVSAFTRESKITVCRILDAENGRFHVAGPLSFQYDIISRAGGLNVTGTIQEAYPKITLTQLGEWDPQVVFNCGFDLNSLPGIANKPEWRSLKAVRSGNVFSFNCGLTCRTGPRIVDMVELLFNTLYGDMKTKRKFRSW
jgi:iron complex transport system substrate-binding protein